MVQFSPNFSPIADRDDGIKILASRFEQLFDLLVEAFGKCLDVNDSSNISAPLSLNGQRIINASAGINLSDVATLANLYDMSSCVFPAVYNPNINTYTLSVPDGSTIADNDNLLLKIRFLSFNNEDLPTLILPDGTSLNLRPNRGNIYKAELETNHISDVYIRKSTGDALVQTLPEMAGSLITLTSNVNTGLYINADGSDISRTTYDRLFSVLGTTYGVGDGSTTFTLPNLNNGAFLRSIGGNAATIGTLQPQSVPNINWTPSTPIPIGMLHADAPRPQDPNEVIQTSRATGQVAWAGTDTSNTVVRLAKLDLSQGNPIYGRRNEVSPINYAVKYMIRI